MKSKITLSLIIFALFLFSPIAMQTKADHDINDPDYVLDSRGQITEEAAFIELGLPLQ